MPMQAALTAGTTGIDGTLGTPGTGH